jgi:hypothetical protein
MYRLLVIVPLALLLLAERTPAADAHAEAIKALKEQIHQLQKEEKEAVHKIQAAFKEAIKKDKNDEKVEKELEKLLKEQHAEIAKVEAPYQKALAKLDRPEDRLELLRDYLRWEEKVELQLAKDEATRKDIRTAYDIRRKVLTTDIKILETEMGKISKRMNAAVGKVKAKFEPQLKPLQQQVKARDLDKAKETAEIDQVKAAFGTKIAALEAQLKALEAMKTKKK